MFYLLSFSVGVGSVLFYPTLQPVWMLLILALGSLALWWRWRLAPLLCLAGLLLGAAYGTWQLKSLVLDQLDSIYEGSTHKVLLQIDSIPDNGQQATSFLGRVLQAPCQPAHSCPDLRGRLVRVSWYLPAQRVEAGQHWWFELRLKRPRGFVNPGGFDYQAWLLSRGIVATAYVKGSAELVGHSTNLASLRVGLKNQLLKSDSRLSYSDFFAGLLVGDTSGIGTAAWTTLQRTGTVHLMAISGLHIGLVAMWGFGAGAVLSRLGQLAGLRHHGALLHCFPYLLSVVAATVYAALAGFALPTVRALVACTCICLAALAGLRFTPFFVIPVCLFVICLLQPMAWISSGFWLSFLAVIILICTLSGRSYGRAEGMLRAQMVLGVGMLLPLLVMGQPVSLVAPLANLLVVPVVSFVVIPLLFLAALLQPWAGGLHRPALELADAVFGWVWRLLEALAALPLASWSPSQALTPAVFSLALLATLLLLCPAGMRTRGLGALLLAATIFIYKPEQPEVRLSVLDVGQGLAAVLQTPESIWVYDTGPRFSETFDAGGQIIAPYLRKLGRSSISLLVSHNDLDHAGGVSALSQQVRIEQLLYGEPVGITAPKEAFCHRGQSWQDGPLTFEVLWPEQPGQLEGNDSSCVVLVRFQHLGEEVRVLLPGDINRSVELKLLSELPAVDVMIAAHHGSKSSSTAAFVARTRPTWVIFSSGYNNRYGHPNKDVVDRFRRASSTILNTATDGAIVISWHKGAAARVWLARRDDRKAWFTGPAAPAKK